MPHRYLVRCMFYKYRNILDASFFDDNGQESSNFETPIKNSEGLSKGTMICPENLQPAELDFSIAE